MISACAVLIAQPSLASPPLPASIHTEQRNELKAFEHRADLELRELRAAHKAEEREFNARERDARHLFFKENTEGPKRREYVQGFLARRKAMRARFKQEVAKKKQDTLTQRQALEAAQAARRLAQ